VTSCSNPRMYFQAYHRCETARGLWRAPHELADMQEISQVWGKAWSIEHRVDDFGFRTAD